MSEVFYHSVINMASSFALWYRGNVAKTDKTWVFDQSKCSQGLIYIIMVTWDKLIFLWVLYLSGMVYMLTVVVRLPLTDVWHSALWKNSFDNKWLCKTICVCKLIWNVYPIPLMWFQSWKHLFLVQTKPFPLINQQKIIPRLIANSGAELRYRII